MARKKATDVTGQVRDPKVSMSLLKSLSKLIPSLRDGVLDRVEADSGVSTVWKAEYAAMKDRTAETWSQWSKARATQVAVSWTLLTVFARFIEDNELFGEHGPVWLVGTQRESSAGEAERNATDAEALRLQFFRADAAATDADWLARIIQDFAERDATKNLVGADCPARWAPLSDAGARDVVALWKAVDDDGRVSWRFDDEGLDTRFLGDLYQDLSEDVRKKYALLQTPDFVEEFILDRTLTPALAERLTLDGFKLIDPTCGSGHFLLGAFERFVVEQRKLRPGDPPTVITQRALDSVFGVDINPYAVAIARFRLLIAAMKSSGLSSLMSCPDFEMNLVAGDSLEYALNIGRFDYGPDNDAIMKTGLDNLTRADRKKLTDILQPAQYDVVVGNPPYITVKDKTLNSLYRQDYSTCHRKYALSVPFMERFFQLTKTSVGDQPAGWTGQITSNSFMKREFGSKLIEEFLPTKDITHIVDTSGAYLPGHGTPTVIIIGQNQIPQSSTICVVMGIQGEPGAPDEPKNGLVWSSIRKHTVKPGYEDRWITVADLDREQFRTHPWSLQGGGASALASTIDSVSIERLGSQIIHAGFGGISGEDDWFLGPKHFAEKLNSTSLPVVVGNAVRNYGYDKLLVGLWPYKADEVPIVIGDCLTYFAAAWPLRSLLAKRKRFGNPISMYNIEWYEWGEVYWNKMQTPLSIVFAEVATHNHFVLDRGGKVFKQTAPVIKLPEVASEDDHLELLAVLNSSVACFWLRQNSYAKGGDNEPWTQRHQFNSNTLKKMPLPKIFPLQRGRTLDRLATQLATVMPAAVADSNAPTKERLNAARGEYEHTRGLLIAQQEELDWECYRLYGITDETLTFDGDLPEIQLGERAFEIVLAQDIAEGSADTTWFERHRSKPVTTIPKHLPADYRDLIQRRLDAIASSRHLKLLEKPEYKRRWASDTWEDMVTDATRDWLLTALETRSLWFDANNNPAPKTVAELSDWAATDPEFMEVLEIWSGTTTQRPVDSLTKLLTDEAVPHCASLRLKPSGLVKRADWEHTWQLQRQEDNGTLPAGTDIPVPPKYGSSDFLKASYWRHRGKLDVPKERFISYPNAQGADQTTMLLGWAGWNHAEQALALVTILAARANEGYGKEVITQLLNGVHEALPWVNQWHPQPHPLVNMPLGKYLADFAQQYAQQYGLTQNDITKWRPPTTTRGRKK